jgi:glycine/D-amino acid oxidase-like deaminating enzyme
MAQLYHPSIYDRTGEVDSFWAASAGPAVEGCAPLEGDHACDVAIIGGGYTGLNAALHLVRDHGIEARVLEAGVPGWGASGRNGGFASTGGTFLSYAEMVRKFGLEETRRFHTAGRESVELVRELAQSEGFEIDAQGDGMIGVAHRPSRMTYLAHQRDAAKEMFGEDWELWSRDELAERAYRGPEAFGGLRSPVGFGLHPLKYSRGLARAALRHGAVIHGHSEVRHWERDAQGHLLRTATGTLRAKRVVLATNGFTTDGLDPRFSGRVMPLLSNVITTRPLTPEERAAQGWVTETPVYDSRHLLFYYRMLPDGRFMLGGRAGTSTAPGTEARTRAWMIRRLGEMWPAWKDVEITHYWRGFVCAAYDGLPHLGPLPDDPTTFFALAYHGSGVAMSSWCGRALAGMIAGDPACRLQALPGPLTRPLPAFPLSGLRLQFVRARYALFQIQDRLP